MRHVVLCSGALLISGAAALIQASGSEAALLRASAEGAVTKEGLQRQRSAMEQAMQRESMRYAARSYLSVVETFSAVSDEESVEHPEWCRSEANLTWKQRRERMQNRETLVWAKQEMKKLVETNQTVPAWMEKVVTDDMNRGRLKWAVQEVKRLKAEGKEVSPWLSDLAAEDARWANRWAACKAAELRAGGEEVPSWMVENGRKGVMEAATEKAAEIQEQLDELDEQREQEVALVDANGDAEVASQRMLARTKEAKTRTMNQQFHILEAALEELDTAEGEMLKEGPATSAKKVKQALRRAKSAAELLNKILERKAQLLLSQMEESAHH